MSKIYNINYTEIDRKYIGNYPKSSEKIAFQARDMIAAKMDIELINTDPEVFSDLYSSGLFFGTDWYNRPVTIFDDELNIYTWNGRIKNIKEDWKNGIVIVKTTNYVQDLADVTCVLSSTSNTTPAEHIYNILKDLIGIDDSYIDYNGFQNAINIQTANSAYIEMRFTKEKGKKCLDVVKELCRMCQMILFTKNNIITLYQWQAWSGILGTRIRKSDILSKDSYVHEYDEKEIYNDYKIYYNNAGTATAVTGSQSAGNYNDRSFLIPNEDVSSTTATDFNIIFINSAGAAWAGALALSRFQHMAKKFKISLREGFNFLHLNEQLDLDFNPFIREPSQIIGIGYDRKSGKVQIDGLFLNTPKQHYARDTEASIPPELISVLPGNKSLFIKWTKSTESDFVGNYLYFTSTLGEWLTEMCNLGQSEIDIKNPDETDDGYYYTWIYELNNGTEYFCKVSAFDTSYNESDESNVLSVYPCDDSDENIYMLQGDPYVDGLTLDIINGGGGSVPSGFTKYGAIKYGEGVYECTAIYESAQLYRSDGFSTLEWRGIGDSEDIMFQYRTSTDGSSWGSWSSETDAIGIKSQSLGGTTYFQYRFIFKSPKWSDSDSVRVTNIAA